MDIPEEILESAFVMNPETDDVIFSGDLREDMIVFSEDPMTRNFIHLTAHSTFKELDENYRQIALKRNRWMKVTQLWDHPEDKAYRFVGVFSDGLKCTVYAPYSMGWYVKKESIGEVLHDSGYPTQSTQELMRNGVRRNLSEMRNEITVIVGTAMEDAGIYSDDLIMWTTKRNRAVNLILKQIQDRKALLYGSDRVERGPSQD